MIIRRSIVFCLLHALLVQGGFAQFLIHAKNVRRARAVGRFFTRPFCRFRRTFPFFCFLSSFFVSLQALRIFFFAFRLAELLHDRLNREDMDKVVAYLLEKETITGGEMVAILEGRDPSTVEEAYASTRKSEDGFRPSQPSVIEAPAKHISMTSEKIEMPPEDKGEDAQAEDKPSTEPETPDTSAENTDENK